MEAGEAQLKQFEVLWAEIARRSNAQQALIALNVTAAGTVGGLVVTGRAGTILLVVLAVVSPVLGLLWIDHARNIGVIADFIRTEWEWQPNWEEHSGKEKASDGLRFWMFAAAMAIVFLTPAVAGLAASIGRVSGWHQGLAWGTAFVLTLICFSRLATQVWSSRPVVLRNMPSSGRRVEAE